MEKMYKPHQKSNALGVLALVLITAVLGSGISALYLWANKVITSVYLCVLVAIVFGVILGFVAKLLISKLKVTSPVGAVIGVLIGCLVFSYFKWSLYVAWDFDEFAYSQIPDQTAAEFYEMEYEFEFEAYDDNGNLMSLEDIITEMQTLTAYDYLGGEFFEEYYEYVMGYPMESEEIAAMKADTYFTYFGWGEILGETVEEAVASYETAQTMPLEEFYYSYRKIEPRMTAPYLMLHPATLFEEIGHINEEGRWSYVSNSSSSNSSSMDVNGPLLAVIWILEWFFICIPALAATKKRASFPFIPRDDDWAKLYEGSSLKFTTNTELKSFRGRILQDASVLYDVNSVTMLRAEPAGTYMVIDFYHSSDYEENYLCVNATVQQNKKKPRKQTLVQYLAVDKKFLYTLFRYYNVNAPFDDSEFRAQDDTVYPSDETQDEGFPEDGIVLQEGAVEELAEETGDTVEEKSL